VAANPVHLMYVLEQQIEREQFPSSRSATAAFIKEFLRPRYAEFIGKEIQTAYLESYSEYGQNIFDRYVTYADFWIQDQEYRDPTPARSSTATRSTTSSRRSRSRPASATPRTSATRSSTSCCARGPTTRQEPRWTSYEKLRAVIEKKMFSNTEDLLPVISFNAKASADDQKKHQNFVNRMVEKGYTEKQVRLLCEWYCACASRRDPGRSCAAARPCRVLMTVRIIDRRLDSKNKSAVNRSASCAASRARCVAPWPTSTAASGSRQRREDRHARPGHRRAAVPPRPWRRARVVHPATTVLPGDRIDRPGGGGGRAGQGGQQRGRGRGRLRLHARAKSSSSSSSTTWRCHAGQAQLARIHEYKQVRAGYSNDGTPTNINVVRSLRGARRAAAAAAPYGARLRELEEALAEALAQQPGRRGQRASCGPRSRPCAAPPAVPFIDPIDLRYNNRIKVPKPTTQAVMFCLMDVSGSMDEARKDMAKRFFILLYLFLNRNYERSMVFIRHHTPPKRSTRTTSSTRASPAAPWCPARSS
jgi:hypothetical protein